MRALLVVMILASAGVAHAYPQYQIARDPTCTGCHISPAGGVLLNENGMAVAESTSQFGTAPEFMYGKLGARDWLVLGGDVRGAGGYLKYGGAEDNAVYGFPMQIELYGHLKFGHIAVHATFGFRPPQANHKVDPNLELTKRPETYVFSREHYLMYQQKPDENYGLYVRAGRFMPVFGLRFAEHPMYTRRFGGTQLYSDTYGLAVEYLDPKFEVHATGFIEDYVTDPVEHANGGALYAEVRPTETVAIGGEFMFKSFTNGESLFSGSLNNEYNEVRAGITNKLYIKAADLLLQTELQFVNKIVDKVDRSVDSQVGGAPKGFVGSLVASRMLTDWLLLDVGFGYFADNYRVPDTDRECVDLNLHWFTTSHLELILNTRYELIGFGNGNDPGSYALLQLHYRL